MWRRLAGHDACEWRSWERRQADRRRRDEEKGRGGGSRCELATKGAGGRKSKVKYGAYTSVASMGEGRSRTKADVRSITKSGIAVNHGEGQTTPMANIPHNISTITSGQVNLATVNFLV
jgi:hypothetical protein